MGKLIGDSLTFDDISVVPINSKVPFENVSLKTRLTKKIILNSPIISASMDTVTESRMAIAIARQGGIGIIHDNMTHKKQASEVDRVKRSENGVITDPFSLSPNNYVYEADDLIAKFKISGVPIVESGLLVGIITNRDLKFEDDHNKKIYEVMTRDNLVTAPMGTTIEEASRILKKHKVEKLPLVDEYMNLKGLITIKDIKKPIKYPNSAKDEQGRLLVGAKVSLADYDYIDRIKLLVDAKVDAIFIENINDYSKKMIDNINKIKKEFSDLDIIVGGVVTKEGARALAQASVDAILVGFGAGSVNFTRVITGVGIPQITAINNCLEGVKEFDIPVISNGGIRYSGDIVKAITAGANACILGNLLAGSDESPGDVEIYKGRKYKIYRGIKSHTSEKEKNNFIPEAVDARVTYKGSVKNTIEEILNGVKSGMSYCGVSSIDELIKNGKYVKVTYNGNLESHINNISVTKESSNYTVSKN